MFTWRHQGKVTTITTTTKVPRLRQYKIILLLSSCIICYINKLDALETSIGFQEIVSCKVRRREGWRNIKKTRSAGSEKKTYGGGKQGIEGRRER